MAGVITLIVDALLGVCSMMIVGWTVAIMGKSLRAASLMLASTCDELVFGMLGGV